MSLRADRKTCSAKVALNAKNARLTRKCQRQQAALSIHHNFQGEDSPKLSMVTSIVESLDKKPLLVLGKFVDVGLVSGCV